MKMQGRQQEMNTKILQKADATLRGSSKVYCTISLRALRVFRTDGDSALLSGSIYRREAQFYSQDQQCPTTTPALAPLQPGTPLETRDHLLELSGPARSG